MFTVPASCAVRLCSLYRHQSIREHFKFVACCVPCTPGGGGRFAWLEPFLTYEGNTKEVITPAARLT
jgi:hypothetical protein